MKIEEIIGKVIEESIGVCATEKLYKFNINNNVFGDASDGLLRVLLESVLVVVALY